jgi:cytochrome c oxidase subunit II
MSDTSRRRGRWFGLVVLVALVAAGCAKDAPYDTLEPQGKSAKDIDGLFNLGITAAAVVFVLVMAGVVVVALRFRRRGGGRDDFDHNADDDLPDQIHGNTKAELGWTIAPAILLAVLAVPTVALVFDLADAAENADMEIKVYGQQWWWEFDYEDAGITTANTIVIPVGETVRLSMTSRDVIHSFWIPALNGKKDVAPGRTHIWSIEAEEPGVFWGQCVEFCGLSHANMRIRAVALPADQYAEWVTQMQQDAEDPGDGELTNVPRADEPGNNGDPNLGYTKFGQFCASCHVIDSVYTDAEGNAPLKSGAAPNLTHLMSRTGFAGNIFDLYNADHSVNLADLRAWVHNAPGQKPMAPDDQRGMISFEDVLTREDVDDIVAYLLTLGEDPLLPEGTNLEEILRR